MSAVRPLLVHALSPLHAGTGQSIGAIDLAIARDRATQYPYLPGSSLKGSLRDIAEQRDKQANGGEQKLLRHSFGPDTAKASEHAGALVISDANLLLLPVRSVAGTFAWVTSPYLLHRWNRDLAAAGLSLSLPGIPWLQKLMAQANGCLVTTGSAIVTPAPDPRVIFEDLDLLPIKEAGNEEAAAKTSEDPLAELAKQLGEWLFAGDADASFWQANLKSRLCIVHDDVMTFLAEHATDVVARVALNDQKTVDNLWHEESLPTESVLAALVLVQEIDSNTGTKITSPEVLSYASQLVRRGIQLGGKATVGRGRCRLSLIPPGVGARV
ncbi:type III-B CRISPR module RAMP protein Cmr4 [Haliangium sp. UPWRP_2]|uniref:type III-B CRISPR module RAMP protein Cmr4 n=1 Tax=Haliangium sp. UPWRP_2 TaxID=1931276 RepID=UPI000B5434F1|nr:type III-B CRISPR module RAMP protein Cmr4 [Haliangium sp. UPWRP_2]PSM32302.1 type III-B CRISPR module RAMP protein Cmr4 [Haliangium sp. UPWRP_2]